MCYHRRPKTDEDIIELYKDIINLDKLVIFFYPDLSFSEGLQKFNREYSEFTYRMQIHQRGK